MIFNIAKMLQPGWKWAENNCVHEGMPTFLCMVCKSGISVIPSRNYGVRKPMYWMYGLQPRECPAEAVKIAENGYRS